MYKGKPFPIPTFGSNLFMTVDMQVEGAMDAANILKPALAQGSLHCIGATTFAEYEEYIARDSAIARRLQRVIVDEPSAHETLGILRGAQGRYEAFHQVRYRDAALQAAVTLAVEYSSDRKLPDSAIDLMDEAAAVRVMQRELEVQEASQRGREDEVPHGESQKVVMNNQAGVSVAKGEECAQTSDSAVASNQREQSPEGFIAERGDTHFLADVASALTRTGESTAQHSSSWPASHQDLRASVSRQDQPEQGRLPASRNLRERNECSMPADTCHKPKAASTNGNPALHPPQIRSRTPNVCPHCGDFVPNAHSSTLICPACGTLFLNEPVHRLVLGTTVLTAPKKSSCSPLSHRAPGSTPCRAQQQCASVSTGSASTTSASSRKWPISRVAPPICWVERDHVLAVVATQVGVPLRLLQATPESFAQLQRQLEGNVVGQASAIRCASGRPMYSI
jgi:ATP-dependent Clp protease ATP-binding subunit ClpA